MRSVKVDAFLFVKFMSGEQTWCCITWSSCDFLCSGPRIWCYGTWSSCWQTSLMLRYLDHMCWWTWCYATFMTPCRTEKVDFSKKLKKQKKNRNKNRITKKTNRQEETEKKQGKNKKKNKKKNKNKSKLRKMQVLFFFDFFLFFFFVFFLFFSCFFLGFGFLVCFFCLLWFCFFFCFFIFFVKPYILCVVGLITLLDEIPLQWHGYLLLPCLQATRLKNHANVKIDDSTRLFCFKHLLIETIQIFVF